jgi:hypothetical protein
MKPKSIAGISLIIFAAVSLAMLGWRESGGTKLPNAQVTICFFRGAQKCAECQTIEAFAKEAAESGFAGEMKEGRVAFCSINWEGRGNRHFQDDFKLGIATVVLVWRDGQFKKLDGLRYLLEDKPAFMQSLQREVADALKEAQ